MDDLYRDYILDHYKRPRNSGVLDPADVSYSDNNPLCGDEISMTLRLEEGRVVDVRFKGKGCAISQASASMLTDELIGKSLDDVKKIDKNFILEMLGIPLGPTRIKCALLSLKVVKGGVYGINTWPDEEDEE